MIYLLLILGVGLSILSTELLIGLRHSLSRVIGTFAFFCYCGALLVGSVSHVNHFLFIYWPHPLAMAIITYWVIVFIGVTINREL